MLERRRTARRRVCLAGHARVATFMPEIACAVRDVSLDGARIRVPPVAALPKRFDLVIPSRGETRRASVAWRAGDLIGLTFKPAPAAEAAHRPSPPIPSHVPEVARPRTAPMAGTVAESDSVH